MQNKLPSRFKYYTKRIFFLFRYIFSANPKPSLDKMDYDAYWVQRKSFDFSHRYPVFADIIEDNSFVFDIGCGNGATLDYIRQKKHIRPEGIDISSEAVRDARSRGIEASVADISSPDFQITKTYDYIIISEVLEHIPNPEEIMVKIKDKFKKAVIISCPNIGHYMHRLRLAFGRFPIQWVYYPAEHLRFWTVKDFKNWLDSLSFQIIGIRVFSGVPYLRRVMPNLFADSVIFVLKQK